MSGESFTMIGPIVGFAITTVSCIGCVFGIRACRRRREFERQLANQLANQTITPPLPIQVVTYRAPQQPYVMGYTQPLAPVGYYPYQQPVYYPPPPKPSAPLSPIQEGPFSD